MKKKLIAFGIVVVLYIIMVAMPYVESFIETPKRYIDDTGDATRHFSLMSFFPFSFWRVLNLALYTLMIVAPIIFCIKLKIKWLSFSVVLYLLSLLIVIPFVYSNGGIDHLFITGLHPFLGGMILIPILYQVWFFTYTIQEFLSKIKLNINS